MDEGLRRFNSGLASMESSANDFDDVVADVVASGKAHVEEIHGLAEAQTEVKSGIDFQQSNINAIAESLKNLPDLLQSNREKQALRLENEQLRLKYEGYVKRIDKLLDFSKKQKIENEELKAQVQKLENKVSGYSTRMHDVIALAKEKQAEIDALRDEANDNDASNSNKADTFGVNFFSS